MHFNTTLLTLVVLLFSTLVIANVWSDVSPMNCGLYYTATYPIDSSKAAPPDISKLPPIFYLQEKDKYWYENPITTFFLGFVASLIFQFFEYFISKRRRKEDQRKEIIKTLDDSRSELAGLLITFKRVVREVYTNNFYYNYYYNRLNDDYEEEMSEEETKRILDSYLEHLQEYKTQKLAYINLVPQYFKYAHKYTSYFTSVQLKEYHSLIRKFEILDFDYFCYFNPADPDEERPPFLGLYSDKRKIETECMLKFYNELVDPIQNLLRNTLKGIKEMTIEI